MPVITVFGPGVQQNAQPETSYHSINCQRPINETIPNVFYDVASIE